MYLRKPLRKNGVAGGGGSNKKEKGKKRILYLAVNKMLWSPYSFIYLLARSIALGYPRESSFSVTRSLLLTKIRVLQLCEAFTVEEISLAVSDSLSQADLWELDKGLWRGLDAW